MPSTPIPITRVERVDDEPSHGEVPGTAAYRMRTKDAVPDELVINTKFLASGPPSPALSVSRPTTPGGTPIPKTVVDMIDPTSPSHGEVPGTAAYAKRKADAVPDAIRKIPSPGEQKTQQQESEGPKKIPRIPRTVVTRVDSKPAHGEVPGTRAYDIRIQDAEPDVLEKKGDVPSKYVYI